jgi:major vault protein
MLENHQYEMISKTLELADADAKIKVVTALAEVEKKEADLQSANRLYKLSLEQKIEEEKLAKEEAIKVKIRAMNEAEAKAKQDMQKVLTAIEEAELARKKAVREAEVAHAKELAAIEAEKQKAYADTVEQMVKAISPDLIAALTTSANADLLATGMKTMSPYAIANGESVSDTVNKLLRGTPLEGMLDKMVAAKSE